MTSASEAKSAPKTHHSYALLVRLHLVPGLGHLRLGRLQPEHLESFLELSGRPACRRAPASNLRAVLCIALNRAI